MGLAQDSSFLTPNFITKFLGVPPNGGPQTRAGSEKFSDFLALRVNVSKTVADKVTIND